MPPSPLRRSWLVAFTFAISACGDDAPDREPGGPVDAATGDVVDGADADAGTDAGADAGADAGVDGEADGGPGVGVWSSFSTTAKSLTLVSSENLIVNSPFHGIEVRRNGTDITDDIVDVTTLSPTSWRYSFGGEILDAPGDTIAISLANAQLATPGHYIAVREGATAAANTPQSMYQLLSDCQAGDQGPCLGNAPIPGLLSAVKGLARRYLPRDLEKASGYDFSPVFEDAAFVATKGLKLHVMFTVRTFARVRAYNGDGSTKTFDIPSGWDKARDREVHLYVDNLDTPFTFNATKTQVNASSAPPAGTGNVEVMVATDPFPDHTWQLTPPVGGWYAGSGGNYGFVHAPWRQTCRDWMASFMRAFRVQWTAAIAANPALAHAIDAISVQETANGLGGAGYSEAAYRAGLVEYAKYNARAVRRRAIHGQLFNQIAGGGGQALADLAVAIIPWGSRLEGPDLFNDNTGLSGNAGLEFGAYERVHREQHDLALTMIWAQHNSYAEPKPGGGLFSMTAQFEKAQKAVTDASTAGGHLGLEAESVFWNMTQGGPGFDWKDALPVIAAHPVIQTSGNDRNLWRLQSTGVPIADQALTRVNP
jgi:hypothetical protein